MACFAFAGSTSRAPASGAVGTSDPGPAPSTTWCPAASSSTRSVPRRSSFSEQMRIFTRGPRDGERRPGYHRAPGGSHCQAPASPPCGLCLCPTALSRSLNAPKGACYVDAKRARQFRGGLRPPPPAKPSEPPQPRRRKLLASLRPFGLLAAGLQLAARPARSSLAQLLPRVLGADPARPVGEDRDHSEGEQDRGVVRELTARGGPPGLPEGGDERRQRQPGGALVPLHQAHRCVDAERLGLGAGVAHHHGTGAGGRGEEERPP